jgi:hypothetical protein
MAHSLCVSAVFGCGGSGVRSEILGEKEPVEASQKVLSGGDVHWHLSRIHQQIQVVYHKWMMLIVHNWRSSG